MQAFIGLRSVKMVERLQLSPSVRAASSPASPRRGHSLGASAFDPPAPRGVKHESAFALAAGARGVSKKHRVGVDVVVAEPAAETLEKSPHFLARFLALFHLSARFAWGSVGRGFGRLGSMRSR